MPSFRAVRPSNFERPDRAERVRRNDRHFSSAPAKPSGLERPELARAAISSALAEPSWLERSSRAPWRSRAGSSGRFERSSGAERPTSSKRRHVRCFRSWAEPAERVRLWSLWTLPKTSKPSYCNFELDRYVHTNHMNPRSGLPRALGHDS